MVLAIYCASMLFLIGGLDWRLAMIVVVWIGVFSLLARYFVPRIRFHSRETAEAASMLSGRMVDAYSNIQRFACSATATPMTATCAKASIRFSAPP